MDEEEIDLGPGLPRVPFLGELEDLSSSNSNSIEDEGEEGAEDDEENEQSRKRAREPIAELPLVIDDQPPLKASSPNRLPALEDYGGDGPIYSENDQYEILARATQENADIITEELKKVGFISPEFAYIKEWQRRRDPMLTILYGPNTVVEMPGPKPGDEPVQASPMVSPSVNDLTLLIIIIRSGSLIISFSLPTRSLSSLMATSTQTLR